jgi:CcmD family protein
VSVLAEIPLHTAVPYVAGAFTVFFALILLYVAIMAAKLSRIERELGELTELAARGRGGERERGAP